MAISRRCNGCMRVLWSEEREQCPYCRADLTKVGVWTDEAKRAALAPGQVYLIFSGDCDLPYTFAKIIRIIEDDLRVKLFKDDFPSEQQPRYDPARMLAGSAIAAVSLDMFFAWGPPKFPILIADEGVTQEELDPRNWLP